MHFLTRFTEGQLSLEANLCVFLNRYKQNQLMHFWAGKAKQWLQIFHRLKSRFSQQILPFSIVLPYNDRVKCLSLKDLPFRRSNAEQIFFYRFLSVCIRIGNIGLKDLLVQHGKR